MSPDEWFRGPQGAARRTLHCCDSIPKGLLGEGYWGVPEIVWEPGLLLVSIPLQEGFPFLEPWERQESHLGLA